MRSDTAVVLMVFLVTGCSSTGTGQFNVDLRPYDEVYFSEAISLFDQRFVPDIARALERHGFTVVTEPPPTEHLVCRLAIDQSSVWNFRVHISLWDGQQMLVVAEARNKGFGTLLSRETALQSLVGSAIGRLEEELRRKGR
jgi:hypothetical protein